jgi:hypothetical protein
VARLLDVWTLAPTALAERANAAPMSDDVNGVALELLNQLSHRGAVYLATLSLMRAAASGQTQGIGTGSGVAAAAVAAAGAGGGGGASSSSSSNVDGVDSAERTSTATQMLMVDFCSCFVERCAQPETLIAGWPSLLTSMRHQLTVGHAAVLPLLMRALYCLVRRLPIDRQREFRQKVRRDLHDVTTRIVERCFALAGSDRGADAHTGLGGMPVVGASPSPAPSPAMQRAAERDKRRSMPIIAAPRDHQPPANHNDDDDDESLSLTPRADAALVGSAPSNRASNPLATDSTSSTSSTSSASSLPSLSAPHLAVNHSSDAGVTPKRKRRPRRLSTSVFPEHLAYDASNATYLRRHCRSEAMAVLAEQLAHLLDEVRHTYAVCFLFSINQA